MSARTLSKIATASAEPSATLANLSQVIGAELTDELLDDARSLIAQAEAKLHAAHRAEAKAVMSA